VYRQLLYAGDGLANIIFLDKSIPEEKKARLREEYRKWWEKRITK
jgi:hypothetical protein